jgi:dienelactone hydrolase
MNLKISEVNMLRFFLLLLLVQIPLMAKVKTETVEYKDGDIILKGFLAYNTNSHTKLPAVLIVHEWWGLNDYPKMRAEQLAELGYVAFAVDMYGDGKVASSPDEAGKLAGGIRGDIPKLRTRITAALEWLKKNKHVDPHKIAAIGYCFGGSVALELARSGADIKGVVVFHGGLSTPNASETKDVKAKILVCTGGDDKFVPQTDIIAFQKEMNDAKVDWQMNVYSGAVHAFTNPKSGSNPAIGVAYNEKADKRSFEAMKQFFHEIFN